MSLGKCAKGGISREIEKPKISLKKHNLERKKANNREIIEKFKKSYKEIEFLLEQDFMFVLFDHQGVLLKKNVKEYDLKNKYKCIEEGYKYTEKSIGTNVISLILGLQKPIYLAPEENYNKLLKYFHSVSLPLLYKEKLLGGIAGYCLNKERRDKSMKKKLISNSFLLKSRIIKKYKKNNFEWRDKINLSQKQEKILYFLTNGFIEKEIAHEICCSNSTVKYHKKQIFDKLEVESTIEAIVKAIKLGIINLEEIGL